tara:strand:+ start:260 stop:1168 length:909 start_codon:yes stop_codon:yes gene_type:complete
MAIVEGLIKPWAKHQSAETAAQVTKQSLRGADLAKKQAIKVHLQKIKQPRFTQVVDEVIENPNDLGLEAARADVAKRKFSGLTERSLPITDRIIDLDEVDSVVKDRYRTKLRDFYNRNNQSLRGYREEIGLLNVAGQDIRGKINVSKGVRDVKLKNTLKDTEERTRRKLAEESQTVNPEDKFTGGHHRFELSLGAAITDGLEETQLKPFWKLVQNSYPNIFPGNHPYNQVAFDMGFTDKLHKAVHRKLNAAGLDPKKVKKALAGKTAGEKFAFMEKVSKVLEEIDDFMAREMRKNRQRGVFS